MNESTLTADEDKTEPSLNKLELHLQSIPNKELEIILGDLN